MQEAARAFTGWNFADVVVVNKEQHDDGEKTFLGGAGADEVDVIDMIMGSRVTAEFISAKSIVTLCARIFRLTCRNARASFRKIGTRNDSITGTGVFVARFLQSGVSGNSLKARLNWP